MQHDKITDTIVAAINRLTGRAANYELVRLGWMVLTIGLSCAVLASLLDSPIQR